MFPFNSKLRDCAEIKVQGELANKTDNRKVQGEFQYKLNNDDDYSIPDIRDETDLTCLCNQ